MRKIQIVIFLLSLVVLSGCEKKEEKLNQKVEKNFVQRVVALSPAAGEILFAVGAGEQVVAVSQFTDYPPEAVALPQVGGFDGKTLSMESILSFKPDLVYMNDVMHNFMIGQLEEYGIKYYLSKAESVEGVMKEILDIGDLTGHSEKAHQVVDEMKVKIESVREKTNQQKLNQNDKEIFPSGVYWEVWNSPYMSAGGSSFITDVIALAGGKNIFDDMQDAYPIVSEEAIIKRSPDVILLPFSSGVSADDVCARIGWGDVSAVVNSRIYVVDDNVFTRPGPRIADVIEEISQMLQN